MFNRSEHLAHLFNKQCLPVSVPGATLGVEIAVKSKVQGPGARLLAGDRTCTFGEQRRGIKCRGAGSSE